MGVRFGNCETMVCWQGYSFSRWITDVSESYSSYFVLVSFSWEGSFHLLPGTYRSSFPCFQDIVCMFSGQSVYVNIHLTFWFPYIIHAINYAQCLWVLRPYVLSSLENKPLVCLDGKDIHWWNQGSDLDVIFSFKLFSDFYP